MAQQANWDDSYEHVFGMSETELAGLAHMIVTDMNDFPVPIPSMTLVVVDQMAGHALALADRAYLLETGAVVKTGPAHELAHDPALEQAYLGGSSEASAQEESRVSVG